jgi:hypothetical protein
MTYGYPVCVFAADKNLLKLQRLQNKILRTIVNFPRRISVLDLYFALKLLYIYCNVYCWYTSLIRGLLRWLIGFITS